MLKHVLHYRSPLTLDNKIFLGSKLLKAYAPAKQRLQDTMIPELVSMTNRKTFWYMLGKTNYMEIYQW
jgi:hypothetical protein